MSDQVPTPPNGNGVEPALNKPAKELFFDIGKRILLLVSKLIGVKMVILVGFGWLALKNPEIINGGMLVFVAMIVIFGREALKLVDKFRK